MKYRKKPVVIDAFIMGVDPRPDWFTDKVNTGDIITYLVDEESRYSPFEFQETYTPVPRGTL